MAYTCELSPGQRLHVDNIGEQTVVTLSSGSAGQQQQSTSRFTTGAWVQPPQMFGTEQGLIIQLTTAQGVQHLQLQGTQMSWMAGNPTLSNAQLMPMNTVSSTAGSSMPPMQPMQPMKPMQPMQPMKMGNMEMNANPMEMRMGNMEMRMGNMNGDAPKPKFCTQCGTPVKPNDRFCANCGHQLGA